MKFYEQTPEARRHQLVQEGSLTSADADLLAAARTLPDATATRLIENAIGEFSLPMGIARNLMVNGQQHQVPIVNEEPSVVAAASNGARMVAENGGVLAHVGTHEVVAEVVLTDLADLNAARQILLAHQETIAAVANASHPSMVQRGGGFSKMTVTILANRFLKLRLTLNPKEAMGANYANTVAEAVADAVTAWVDGTVLASILTNAPSELVTATVEIGHRPHL
ncbi:hydroxymethylglutaryl-CoA reductase, partial [Lacticaseibacillus rhamnosus]